MPHITGYNGHDKATSDNGIDVNNTMDSYTMDANMMDADVMHADAMDANAFEAPPPDDIDELNSCLPEQEPVIEPLLASVSDIPFQLSAQIGAAGPETTSTVIIKRFPFGCPGAPIFGPHQTSAPNASSATDTGDSIWSPFCSRLDWELARWAKMRGPTSSALTELLAIPGVSALLFPLVAVLMHRPRSLTGLDFHTERQNNWTTSSTRVCLGCRRSNARTW